MGSTELNVQDAQIAQEHVVEILPPTSPIYGFSHPISRNIMFTAPPNSRFVLAPNASLSVTVFQARNLELPPGTKVNPYVRASQGEFKYMTTTAHTDHPVWNETFRFPIVSPVKELVILELWNDKTFKTLLGYVPIDISLLPRGVEVITWEKLSHSDHGELSIGLKAEGFGLETLPLDYDTLYEQWRGTIPPVSKTDPVPKKGQPPAADIAAPGPYAGKKVPDGYVVDQGHVKRVPSAMAKALGRAKGLLTGKAAN